LHRDEKTGGRGKSAAMNYGFHHSNGEIILCFDADYYPQIDIVEKLTREFADPKVGAVQGRVVVLNGGFRRSDLELLGGWDESVLAEDTDLTFRVYLAGFKVRYIGGAECYEEAVDSWNAYRTQRYRWAVGHMDCFFRHSWKVLFSRNMRLKEKVDGLLLL
jgi:cellulose synthase/poly-beta-1,6-N-acetylglucosamine synthase-like glycosyltransferase